MEGKSAKTFPPCSSCGKCQPCPAKLEIPLMNRYYDEALAGDETARERYMALERTARWCAQCGRCDGLCPVKAEPMGRMWAMYQYFGA